MITHNKTTLVIFTTVAALGILTTSTVLTLQPAHALTKFFNCTTEIANKTHNLTLQDINACYNKEFRSSGGASTGITPTTTTTATTTESGVHRSSLHHYGTIRTSIHSPSSEGSHRASLQNEGFSSSSAAAAAASTDEIPGSDSGVDSSISASGDVVASSSSSSSSSGGASASSTATAR